ncbi:MAG: Hsp20/alpha crystallin family protein [Candidatus Omnitrophica bacterium]|nr:Hsp20/alpha crystallin family protein [Candidatus Omnitrophota bacterium]
MALIRFSLAKAMVAKKSFFERLTGATKEEVLGSQPEDETSLLEKIDLEESEETPLKPKVSKTKKSAEEPAAPSIDKATTNKPFSAKATEDKKDWLPEEEGQLTLDVYQTENDIVIKSTIAGVKSEDLDISITNDMITIKGARRQGESVPQENYYYQELYWGPFSRSVILPVDVDTEKAKASMKNGILTIRLPKTEREKTKVIKVKEVE